MPVCCVVKSCRVIFQPLAGLRARDLKKLINKSMEGLSEKYSRLVSVRMPKVMMPKLVGDILAQMTRIVRFWSFAFLDNTIIAIQEKIPLYKILKMLFRESAMDS